MTLRRKIVALATGSCPDPSINVPFLMNSRGEELVMAVVPMRSIAKLGHRRLHRQADTCTLGNAPRVWTRDAGISLPRMILRAARSIFSPWWERLNRCACTRSWRPPDAFPPPRTNFVSRARIPNLISYPKASKHSLSVMVCKSIPARISTITSSA